MRDQYDAQIWNDGHDQFSEWADGLAARTAGGLRRGAALGRHVPSQLLAGLLAVSLTLLTFTASAA